MRAIIIFIILSAGLEATSQVVLNDWMELPAHTTLQEYIDDRVYSHLEFKPNKNDSTGYAENTNSPSSTAQKLIIRDQPSQPKAPQIVINGNILVDQNLLHQIKLADLKEIGILKPELSRPHYGSRSHYGVILVVIKKRKWKKLAKS